VTVSGIGGEIDEGPEITFTVHNDKLMSAQSVAARKAVTVPVALGVGRLVFPSKGN
jgi:hypothetical protein